MQKGKLAQDNTSVQVVVPPKTHKMLSFIISLEIHENLTLTYIL